MDGRDEEEGCSLHTAQTTPWNQAWDEEAPSGELALVAG